VADGIVAPAVPGWGLRSDRGHVLPLNVDRWFAEPSLADTGVLDQALGPVLDVGCGPARHTLALLSRGVPAVGLDVSPSAVRIARRRGAPVLQRSVFDRLPDEGAWGTALLLDGNVGIGGDPVSLFQRVRRILRPGGRALVEVEPPGTRTERLRVRFDGPGASRWFPWARVGVDGLHRLAGRVGFVVAGAWAAEGRWFGRLDA
jgi:SAM-dependent methyltransferase